MNRTSHPRLPRIRQSFGARWPGKFPPLHWWMDAAYIALAAALLYAAYEVVAINDESAAAAHAERQQRIKVASLEYALITCINGGTLAASDGSVIGCREAETVGGKQ